MWPPIEAFPYIVYAKVYLSSEYDYHIKIQNNMSPFWPRTINGGPINRCLVNRDLMNRIPINRGPVNTELLGGTLAI